MRILAGTKYVTRFMVGLEIPEASQAEKRQHSWRSFLVHIFKKKTALT